MNIFKTVFFVSLIILSTKANSQDYIEYQKEITKAENYMFDGCFKESIQLYRKTFDAYEFNFPRDCMIAAQIANKYGDDTNTYYFLKKALRYGVPIENISNNSEFRFKYFIKDLQKEYLKIRNQYTNSINLEYKDLCNKLYIKDQEIRDKDQDFWRNRYFVWQKSLRRKWENNSREIVKLIDSLIPIYGYPSYRTIGLIDTSSPKTYINNVSSDQVLIPYIHYMSMNKEKDPKFLENLYDEVVKGNLSARDYALLCEFDYRQKHKKEIHNFILGKSLYYIRWEVVSNKDSVFNDEEEINKRREKIGLSNCYYERLRKLYQHNNWINFYFYEF